MKKQNSGFTLIELIVVIVILGILAVTAAPKFMNLQSDARKAALENLKGSIVNASQMVYGKAIVASKEKAVKQYICHGSTAASNCTESSTDAIEITYGYPAAEVNGILKAMDIDAVVASSGDVSSHDWAYRYKKWGSGLTQVLIGFPNATDRIPDHYSSSDPQSSNCYLFYTTPIKDKGLNILLFTDGC